MADMDPPSRRRRVRPGVDPAERVAVEACGEHDEPWRIMFLGDVHGYDRWVGHALKVAARAGAQLVVQLGDMGYWEHEHGGITYLDNVEWHAARRGIPVVFVRGNHDHPDLLRTRYTPSPSGLVPVRPHVWWAPDGCRWTWSGVSFVAAGGAYSVDVAYRTEDVDWWPTEELAPETAEAIIAGGHADVVVSHDCPAGVSLGVLKNIPQAEEHRRRLAAVVEGVTPAVVVHGHYHMRNSETLTLKDGARVRVEGLDCENSFDRAWWVVDVDDLAVRP